ncbi:MAG: YCF48-related protein [Myxococcota bacterium]|nr:hypothetical protein [Myxococcales bacterium]
MSRAHWLASAVLASLATFGCHEVHLDFDVPSGDIEVLDNLFSVSAPDADHAVAVGYYGAAYWTDDGGTSWHLGNTGTQALLYSVSMADAQRGWAVGQRGLILRTEDGGKSWVQQPNLKEKEGSHLFSIAAIDANTAVAVGEWGTRIRTVDGGASWQDRSFTITEDHPQYVWLAPVEKERVRNGETVYEDVGLNDVTCLRAPSQACWLIGEFGYIFFSTDAGDTWQRSEIAGSVEMEPVRLSFNEIRVAPDEAERIREFGRSIVDSKHLNVAIEAVGSKEEMDRLGRQADDVFPLFEMLEARAREVIAILEDTDVDSDRLRMRGQPPWDFEDFLDDDPGFLDRYLERETWAYPGVKVRVIQNPYLFTVRFRDEQHGLISGLGGVVLRSDDGGRSFEYVRIDRQQALFAVAAVEGRAVAVGEKGLVRVSSDDGASWHEMPEGTFPNVFTFMRDVEFAPDGTLGLIVGQTGRIYRSRDAGFRWELVMGPSVLRGESEDTGA